MRKTKEQKGITLIALIITIIVLLILAVVAIGTVTNNGIIDHAKNAREEYGKAGVNENTTIQSYFDKIQDNLPTGVGTGTGDTDNNENGTGGNNQGTTITFTIDGQQYTARRGMTWVQWIESEDYDSGEFKAEDPSNEGVEHSQNMIYVKKNGIEVSRFSEIEEGVSYTVWN